MHWFRLVFNDLQLLTTGIVQRLELWSPKPPIAVRIRVPVPPLKHSFLKNALIYMGSLKSFLFLHLLIKKSMVQRLKNYMSEAYNELMFKVSWPSWAELQGSVTVVCVASLIVAVLVYAMDVGSNSLLTNFYKLFN